MGDYKPQEIEAKWQKRWEENRVFESEAEIADSLPPRVDSEGKKAQERQRKPTSGASTERNKIRPKYYVLEMLPYPSGTLHM